MSNKTPAIINTDRLCLHSISAKDADDMIALLTNSKIIQTYMIPDFKSHEEELRMFERFKQLSASGERFVYGIYLQEKMIGFINDVEIKENEIELGYVIHPDHKNKGFATEVLEASIQELFKVGYTVVKTGAFEENAASIRVMEKCGMMRLKQEEYIEYRGKVHRCILFEIRK